MANWNWQLIFPCLRSDVATMKARGDVKGLIHALQSERFSVTMQAKEALIALGSAAVEPVIVLLGTEDLNLRRSAVFVLAHCRDARAIVALCESLRDDDIYIQLLAVWALEQIADAHAVAPLIKAAQDAKASAHVQTLLQSVLYRAAETVTSEDLRQATRLNNFYVLIFAQVETSCTFTTYNVTSGEADFTQIKQMARQELIRRGLDA